MLHRPVLFLCLLLGSPTAHPAGMNEHLAQLAQALEAERVTLNIPALVITLVDKDRVLMSESLGIADRNSGLAVTRDHYFRIGSITKTFTALATLRLVEEDRLSLDDRLIDLAPELDLDNPWQNSHAITIEHLLEHTAGLNDLTRKEFDFNEPLSLAGAFQLSPGSRVCRWPPGLHHSYSNASPGILSYVIEKITGLEFEEYVERAVLEPLGMHSATLHPAPGVLKHLITGYDSDGETVIPYWHMTYRAFGALNLKPADMAPFLQLFLNRGQHDGQPFLSVEHMQRMQTPGTTLAARAGLEFGYGFYLYPTFRNGHVIYGHGGDADGYLSRFGYQPDAGLAYFIGINVFRDRDLAQLRKVVEEFIVEGLPTPQSDSITIPEKVLAQYAGDYESVTWRFPNAPAEEVKKETIIVRLDAEQLILIDNEGDERKLYAVNDQHFRFRDEPVATMAFVEYEDELFLQTDFGNYRRLRK